MTPGSPSALTQRINDFIEAQQLPDDFQIVVNDYYLPLAHWLHNKVVSGETLVVGINGAQGTGKSVLSAVLKIILEHTWADRVAILSLDDIYLTRHERQTLAQSVHPLLHTRGVPGTHDVELGIDIIEQLKTLKPGQSMRLPRFDKALDDRKPSTAWEIFTGPTDLILFEGWCVGATPLDTDNLDTPINDLEAAADRDGQWRRYINEQLQGPYRTLFAALNTLIMLQAPDFGCIRRWRIEQEVKLATSNPSGTASAIMDERTIIRFIQHYERLTQHNLREMPHRADVVLSLDSRHQVTDMCYKAS
tara:strand:- start:9593 stop:10507 length:915 start_codon:yes stop_codon:yes gene_type:complete